jgi:hypothetical protein
MKRTIRTLGWRFNVNRTIMDCTVKAYIPAAGSISSNSLRCNNPKRRDYPGFRAPAPLVFEITGISAPHHTIGFWP